MSDFEENAVETVEASPVKKPFNKKKAIIASVVAGALVVGGVIGVNAFREKPEIRLAAAFSNLFNDKDLSVGFSMEMTPEFLAANGMTDSQVQELGRPGIQNLEDAAKALSIMELRVSNIDESTSDDKRSLEFQFLYKWKSVIDLSLIDRTLFLSTDALILPKQKPQIITQEEIDSAISALQMYASFAPQLSGAIDALTSNKALALRFDKGTPLGDAFDEFVKNSDQTTINTKVLDEFKSANTTAIRNSASISVADKADPYSGSEGGLSLILSIDLYKYMKEMEKPLTDLAKEQLDVLGTDFSGTSKKYLKEIKALKGKTLDLIVSMNFKNELTQIAFDLSTIYPDLNIKKWDVLFRINFYDADIEAPTDYYDLTDDLLSLGLV
ncbi:MAG: hypothetical protein RLZZ330_553 [Actinomycetota bacterium]|jgi:hypothetical protein